MDLRHIIAKMFAQYHEPFWAGPDGAVSGAGADVDAGDAEMSDGGDEGASQEDLFANMENIPEEIRDDPDMIEEMRQLNRKPENDETEELENKNAGDNGEDDDAGDDETSEENDSTDTTDEGAFSDDIIPGLKGDVIAGLDEDAKVALGRFVEEHNSAKEQLAAAEAKVNTLLEDPIVKARARRIDSGDAESQYQVRNLNNAETEQIKNLFGLDDEDMVKLKPMIETIARDMAKSIADNAILADRQESEAKRITSEGYKTLRSMSEFNSELAIEEEDLSKFWVRGADGKSSPNTKHPEYEKWSNGIGKIQQWCVEQGINYERAVKMGSKALYAAAAASLGMPVVQNAQSVFDKTKMNEREKFINALKSASQRPSKDKGKSATTKQKPSVLNEGAMDASRFSDPDYVDGLISNAKTDEEIFEIQRMAKLAAAAAK